jgi:hypothetical protein
LIVPVIYELFDRFQARLLGREAEVAAGTSATEPRAPSFDGTVGERA